MNSMAESSEPMIDSESERILLETALQAEDTDVEDEPGEQTMQICSRGTGDSQRNKNLNIADTEEVTDSPMTDFDDLQIKKSLSAVNAQNLSMSTEDQPNGQEFVHSSVADDDRTSLQSQLQDVSRNLNSDFYHGKKIIFYTFLM